MPVPPQIVDQLPPLRRPRSTRSTISRSTSLFRLRSATGKSRPSCKSPQREISLPPNDAGDCSRIVGRVKSPFPVGHSQPDRKFSRFDRPTYTAIRLKRRSHTSGQERNQISETRIPHAMGGFRSAHGRTASKAAAARKISTSLIALEITCSPTGRPLSVKPTGRDAPGLPVKLNG